MKRVYVASANPVKLSAAKHGFEQMFPQEAFEIISFKNQVVITSQPMTEEETLRGALKRAKNMRELAPDGDYWVGIEGGC